MSTIAAPPKQAVFVAKGDNTSLTYEGPRKVQRDSLNRIVVMPSEGKIVQFEKHYARIAPTTVSEKCETCNGDGLIIHNAEGKDCPRCAGEGTVTRDASKVNGALVDVPFDTLVDWLRSHVNFNVADKNCAFWEEGQAPDEPKPTMADQMIRLAEASTLQSLDLIGEVRELEESTHQRVAILQACEAAEKTIALLTADDTDPEAEAAGEGEPDESGSVADDDESSA